jgi:HSP20 family molecular chaperone IbpA
MVRNSFMSRSPMSPSSCATTDMESGYWTPSTWSPSWTTAWGANTSTTPFAQTSFGRVWSMMECATMMEDAFFSDRGMNVYPTCGSFTGAGCFTLSRSSNESWCSSERAEWCEALYNSFCRGMFRMPTDSSRESGYEFCNSTQLSSSWSWSTSTTTSSSGTCINARYRDFDTQYCIEVKLPGMSSKSLSVTAVSNEIRVRTNCTDGKMASKSSTGTWESSECEYYCLPMPASCDCSKIKCTFSNGLLCIWVPKTSESSKCVHHFAISA